MLFTRERKYLLLKNLMWEAKMSLFSLRDKNSSIDYLLFEEGN